MRNILIALILAFTTTAYANSYDDKLFKCVTDSKCKTSKIKSLIKQGANINARDIFKDQALHKASSYNTNPEVIKTLVKLGANINARDEDQKTVIQYSELRFTKDDTYYAIKEILLNARDNQ